MWLLARKNMHIERVRSLFAHIIEQKWNDRMIEFISKASWRKAAINQQVSSSSLWSYTAITFTIRQLCLLFSR